MQSQNQIKRALSAPESIEYVLQLLEGEESFSRTELADFLCEEFGFQDPRGKNQQSSCLVALRNLEAKGWFELPPSEGEKRTFAVRRLPEPVPEPQGVPEDVGLVRRLELIQVESEEQRRTWNELMLGEHPLAQEFKAH